MKKIIDKQYDLTKEVLEAHNKVRRIQLLHIHLIFIVT